MVRPGNGQMSHIRQQQDGQDGGGREVRDLTLGNVCSRVDLRLRDDKPTTYDKGVKERRAVMVAKDRVRDSHTFRPGPFGWCCYDCNEGEANALPSRSQTKTGPDGSDALPSQRNAVNLPSLGFARLRPRAAISSGLAPPEDSLPMAG